jgi:hypothetical protein
LAYCPTAVAQPLAWAWYGPLRAVQGSQLTTNLLIKAFCEADLVVRFTKTFTLFCHFERSEKSCACRVRHGFLPLVEMTTF